MYALMHMQYYTISVQCVQNNSICEGMCHAVIKLLKFSASVHDC